LDKQLTQSVSQGEHDPRFQMLETIRAFGLECLREHGELELAQRAHAHAYLHLAEAAHRALFGSQQVIWIKRLLQDMGNLRQAGLWSLHTQEYDTALRLGAALGPYWLMLGEQSQQRYLLEGVAFLEQALSAHQDQATPTTARALIAFGALLALLGKAERAQVACQKGLELFRQLADLQGAIHALWTLFQAPLAQGDLQAARPLIEEALALAREPPEVCTEWGQPGH
jgi:tetratricopeptide (TPR) repeat protein